MRLHPNARTCPLSRRLLVERVEKEGWTVQAAAAAAGISVRTAYKWLARWRAEGQAGLQDRSSRARTIANKTAPARVEAICALRRIRLTGDQIAALLAMARSTVQGLLRAAGLSRLGRLGLEPVRRYERERPGELVHIDIKRLGRIGHVGKRITGNKTGANTNARLGWDAVHIAIDDATRLAYAEVLPDQSARSAIAFLRRARAFFAGYGITVERVMTDNGSAYISTLHAAACRTMGIRHLRTRAYRPQTNGKAERFIRTMLGEWAYGAIYRSSAERTAALDGWLWHYNHRRTHSALSHKTPAARLSALNNPPELYS
jgi:transposase InsO family protein